VHEVIAIIFAGGVGSRMNFGAVPKQFLEIENKPILVHTLEKFQEHSRITGIAIASHPDWRNHTERLVEKYNINKVFAIVDGGETGQISRHNALRAAAQHARDRESTLVMVHDGVRPLISPQLLTENIECALVSGNAITCTKFNETVAVSKTKVISEIIPREYIYAAQAPQTFYLNEILELYDAAENQGEFDSIDSCSLMEAAGRMLFRVDGPRSNVKITTVEDFFICQAFFEMLAHGRGANS
jgi:2-C-methyl-D-erythritol 4-phosphate cytidylyltransferase